MIKTLIIALIVCASQLFFSQKKEIYINDNFQEISKHEYNKHGENYRFQNVETDSVLYKVRVEHEGSGKLTVSNFNNLKTLLNISENNTKNISENNTKNIAIHYYQGLDKCNQHSDTNQYVINDIKTYIRKFKNSGSNLYFVYREKNGLKNRLKKTNWIADTSGTIENLFFRIKYPCDSAIVIFPDGSFKIFRGEHIWEKVFNTAKK
ncbi:hypothetical protein [Chryseobacterium aquaticum]|uniref:Uncharacterized protein n=1 Tax=Chryseobacterium aquaticum subsp. greenlandense TaxID=345663 RepID=A0A117KD05_9FLAO|nr:hypothetical protein [Chryseobacterium aquaticum]KUJ58243.1 hypothetical protein AR686_00080 [Chryseobacterium aquaticum subsp. greenlandense]